MYTCLGFRNKQITSRMWTKFHLFLYNLHIKIFASPCSKQSHKTQESVDILTNWKLRYACSKRVQRKLGWKRKNCQIINNINDTCLQICSFIFFTFSNYFNFLPGQVMYPSIATWVRISKSFRSPGIDSKESISASLCSLAGPRKITKFVVPAGPRKITKFVIPARQATKAGGIDSRLLKRLQIRAQSPYF